MAVITATELLSASNVNFNAAALDDLGTFTVMAYIKPTSVDASGFGYLFGKTPSASINGKRFFITHASGSPFLTYGDHTTAGTAGRPQVNTAANTVVYNSWGHYAVSADGTHLASGVKIYAGVGVTLADITGATTTNGSGTIATDAANDAVLFNRLGGSRGVNGHGAYVAVWDRVLTLAELQNAQTNGPLVESTGLVLCWANNQDYSTGAITASSRSTYNGGGDMPPNTALGSSSSTGTLAATEAGDTAAISGTVLVQGSLAATETGSDTAVFSGSSTSTGTLAATELGDDTAAIAGDVIVQGTAAATETGSDVLAATGTTTITIDGDYERSSYNPTGSSVTGTGSSAVITIQPRYQHFETVGSRWLEFGFRVTGVDTFTPTFKVLDYESGQFHGYAMASTKRCMFSYDREAWFYFDNQTLDTTNNWITFSHNTAFTQNVVYVARSRQISVTQMGTWLETQAAAYSAFFVPSPTAATFTPSTTTSFPAQTFIADEFATQTDDIGRTVPATPFYAAMIDDTSLMPSSGVKKIAVINAGTHAGEDLGDWAMQRFVEWICSSATEAQDLRRHYKIYLYPLLNASGRHGGGSRGNFAASGSTDANRHFSDASPTLDLVVKPRAVMVADLGSDDPVWMLDFHGTYDGRWEMFVDPGHALHAEFASRVGTNFGTTVNDGGDAHSGSVSKYFQVTQNTPLAIIVEHGDPTPNTDAQYVDWAAALGISLDSMREDGLIEGGDRIGTLVATETGLDVTASTGTVLVQGDFAATETGIDTAAFSGTSAATGALSASESGSDIAAITGAILVSGSLSAQESGSDTCAVAGQVIVTATFTAIESGDDSLASAGTVLVQGDATASESGLDTFAATSSEHSVSTYMIYTVAAEDRTYTISAEDRNYSI